MGGFAMAKKTKKKAVKKSKRKTPAKKGATSKYTIGVLHSGSANDSDHQAHIKEFKAAVAAGYTASVKFDDNHYPEDDPGALADEAKKLVLAKDDVLVASGGTLALNTLIAARANYGQPSTPIVFTSASNPPPANLYLTGVNALTSEYDPQRLELVFELIGRPAQSKIVALKNPRRPNYTIEVNALQDKQTKLEDKWNAKIDLQIVDLPYSDTIDDEISKHFSDFSQNNVQAVIVTADPLYYDNRDSVIKAAKATKFPTIYQWRQFAEDGGLISYGTKLQAAYQMAGAYVGLILNDIDKNGHPTTVLDIQSPVSELVINTKTAIAQNISVPPLLLARAELIS
jgi:putative ABC transport system substrate-binding protein